MRVNSPVWKSAEFVAVGLATLLIYRVGYPIANHMLRSLGDLAWGGPIGWAIIAMAVLTPLYGGFALFIAIGLRKGRKAMASAPVAALVAIYFFDAHNDKVDAKSVSEMADSLRATEVRPFLATHGLDILLVQDEPSCDWLCMQVLAKSSFSYAGSHDQAPVIYRRAVGETCLTPQAMESYVAFLEAGLPGICAVVEGWTPAGRYISIQTTQHVPDSRARISSEPYFEGISIEAVEHGASENRVIGRWAGGVVAVPHRVSAFSLLHQTKEIVGQRPELSEFVSGLLGFEITRWPKPTPEQIPGILDSLVPAFDEDGVREQAIDAFEKIVFGVADEQQARLLAHARRAVTSGRRGQLIAGLALMASLMASQKPDVEFAKPYILDALASDDDELVSAALRSLNAFSDDDQEFARRAVLEVPFGAALPATRSALPSLLLARLCELQDSAPADLRVRARAALESNSLAKAQLLPLIVVLAKGGDVTRTEAFRAVLGLSGERFETAVHMISEKGWECIAGTRDGDWNENELRALVERAKQVPNERLPEYVRDLQRSARFDSVRPAVRDLVRARAEAAGADASTADRVRAALKKLSDQLG